MAKPLHAAIGAVRRHGVPVAGLLAGLLLLLAPAASAAAQPGVRHDRVSFAMRGPLTTGGDQRLVFQLHAPTASRPTVFVKLTMPAMPMHEHTLRAKPLGHGRYAVRAPLTMPGRWLAHVTVEAGGQSVTRVLPFHTIYGRSAPWRLLVVGAGAFALLVALIAYRLRRRPPDVAAAEPHA